MSSFIAYLKQDGGCDYTIGCGNLAIGIEADSLEAAKIKLIKIIEEEYSHDEQSLSSAELFEISSSVKIDINQLYKDLKEKEKQTLERIETELELLEFERLKKKFQNK